MAENIIQALFNVQQKALKPVKGGDNPHFKSKYVTLDALLETVIPALTEEGVLLVQQLTDIEGRPAISTQLVLAETGNSVESRTPLVYAKDDPQAMGSAITYYRRYSLMTLLGLVGEPDDDGESAVDRSSAPKKSRTRAKAGPQPEKVEPQDAEGPYF